MLGWNQQAEWEPSLLDTPPRGLKKGMAVSPKNEKQWTLVHCQEETPPVIGVKAHSAEDIGRSLPCSIGQHWVESQSCA